MMSAALTLVLGLALGPSPLEVAIDDEYKAQAMYQAAIANFGDITPFRNIVLAEGNHISLLKVEMERLNVPIPKNPYAKRSNETIPEWTQRLKLPGTSVETCRLAARLEEENVALYDKLIAKTTDQQVILVFQRLQADSRDRHLPAFRRCAERGGGNRPR